MEICWLCESVGSASVRSLINFALFYLSKLHVFIFYFVASPRLHTEIQQFYEYMQLTPIERALREHATARIESLVQQLWPNAKIKPIGSFSWGLTLPTSDIDIMILGVSDISSLRLLAAKIQHSDIAEKKSIRVKEKSRVPIIEFIDRESKINIDIPLENDEPMAELINKYQQEYPVFVKIAIVLKQFLCQRDLKNPRLKVNKLSSSKEKYFFFVLLLLSC